MKKPRAKKIVLLMIAGLIFLYGMLIPVIPLGKFVFSEAKIVKLYPHNLYLMKFLPNEENPSFREYMNNEGWIYSEEMLSGQIYKKGDSEKYIHVDELISVNIYDSHIKIWQGMTSLFSSSKSTFYIIFLIYLLPAIVFFTFVIRLKSREVNQC